MGKIHGTLAKAGKVKNVTPKVEKQDKKNKPLRGRARKRELYTRRCVNKAKTKGRQIGPNNNATRLEREAEHLGDGVDVAAHGHALQQPVRMGDARFLQHPPGQSHQQVAGLPEEVGGLGVDVDVIAGREEHPVPELSRDAGPRAGGAHGGGEVFALLLRGHSLGCPPGLPAGHSRGECMSNLGVQQLFGGVDARGASDLARATKSRNHPPARWGRDKACGSSSGTRATARS